MIAMALSCNPSLLIADEPTTALDVTIQAQIMDLILELKEEMGMAVLLITHDMGLVAQMADRVLVMYAGQLIEQAPVLELFDHPAHPYTRALLRSVPGIRDEEDRRLESIEGIVPEHYDRIRGCRFARRCPFRTAMCMKPQQEMSVGDFPHCAVLQGEGGAGRWLINPNVPLLSAEGLKKYYTAKSGMFLPSRRCGAGCGRRILSAV